MYNPTLADLKILLDTAENSKRYCDDAANRAARMKDYFTEDAFGYAANYLDAGIRNIKARIAELKKEK